MKKVLKTLLCLILCFCVTFTGVVGTWGLLHKDEVFKFAYIANLIKGNFLFEYQTDDLIEGAITGMVEALDDPYSVYMDKDTTEQMYESNAGVFGGIGIYATLNDDGRVIVSSPIKDGPSEKAGIEARILFTRWTIKVPRDGSGYGRSDDARRGSAPRSKLPLNAAMNCKISLLHVRMSTSRRYPRRYWRQIKGSGISRSVNFRRIPTRRLPIS